MGTKSRITSTLLQTVPIIYVAAFVVATLLDRSGRWTGVLVAIGALAIICFVSIIIIKKKPIVAYPMAIVTFPLYILMLLYGMAQTFSFVIPSFLYVVIPLIVVGWMAVSSIWISRSQKIARHKDQ